MNINIYTSISEKDRNRITQNLKEHNTPFLNRERWGETFVLVHDEDETILGGLIAEQEEDWMFIKYLWVDAHYRNQQLGTQLVSQLVQAAKNQQCTHIMVETFSFQAKPFYERMGFTVQMTLEDCPSKGTNCYYLTKALC